MPARGPIRTTPNASPRGGALPIEYSPGFYGLPPYRHADRPDLDGRRPAELDFATAPNGGSRAFGCARTVTRSPRLSSRLSAWLVEVGQAERFPLAGSLPGGPGDIGDDDVGGVPVQGGPGPYWRTQILELSEYPAGAAESRRRNSFPSSMRLKRTRGSPRPSGVRIQHQKGSHQRDALVRRLLPEGPKRYSDTIVTS
jgi:hypothetical protein